MSDLVRIGTPDKNLSLPFFDCWGNPKEQLSTYSFINNPRVQIEYYKDFIGSGEQWFYVLNYQNAESSIKAITPEVFPDGVLESILEGECTLLLTNYGESYFEDTDLRDVYKLLSHVINEVGIPNHRFKWVTNCIGGQDIFNSYCKRLQLEDLGCTHVTFVEFLLPILPQWDLLNVDKRRFIYLQKLPRPHRMILAMLMFKKQIDAHMSFHYDEETRDILRWALSEYPNTGLQESDIDAFCATLPRKVDPVDLTENTEVHLNPYANTEMLLAMERSGIYVIGETRFHEPGNFFSEKTTKAIFNKKPFIFLGQPNSCKELRNLGFKTFEPYIDESYDSIQDPEQRLIAVANEIDRLYNLSDREFYGKVAQMNHICEYNFNQIRDFGQKAIDLDLLIGKS